MKHSNEKLRVGVLVERQRAYGRRLCEGIADYALAHPDISLGMLEWNDLSNAKKIADFDAFIVRVLDDQMEVALRRTGKPVVDVFYNRRRTGFAVVDLDNVAIARLAAEHFWSRCFRNFAYCGYDGIRFSDVRRDEFVAEVRGRGGVCSVYRTPSSVIHGFSDSVVRGERYALSGVEQRVLTKWLLSLRKPVAIFCSHDLRAHQVLEICQRNGIAVPGEVAILGVDDDTILCGFTSPTISSIDPDGAETGRMAARTVIRMATSAACRRCPPCILIKPSRLIVRDSSEIYPVEPAWLSDALIYIQRNAVKGIRASDVFARVGLSHTTVGRVFHDVCGSTVQDEILRVRLKEACELLVASSLSVREIATACGFASDQYFCKQFVASMGVTPSAYRAEKRRA